MMEKRGKYFTIIVLGILLILVLAFAFAGDKTDTGDDMAGSAGGSSGTDVDTDASAPLSRYMEEQDAIMAEMEEDMSLAPKSGSAAVDFLNGMAPHHESAVAMAESYLKNGAANEDLKQLAESIIEQQSEEIEQMKIMSEKLADSGRKDEEAEAAYLEEYNKMFEDSHSHMVHGAAANVDRAFADGMIMHHQMAVDMAKAILNHTDESDVRKLAQDIIDLQEEEIGRMREIIKDNGL